MICRPGPVGVAFGNGGGPRAQGRQLGPDVERLVQGQPGPVQRGEPRGGHVHVGGRSLVEDRVAEHPAGSRPVHQHGELGDPSEGARDTQLRASGGGLVPEPSHDLVNPAAACRVPVHFAQQCVSISVQGVADRPAMVALVPE